MHDYSQTYAFWQFGYLFFECRWLLHPVWKRWVLQRVALIPSKLSMIRNAHQGPLCISKGCQIFPRLYVELVSFDEQLKTIPNNDCLEFRRNFFSRKVRHVVKSFPFFLPSPCCHSGFLQQHWGAVGGMLWRIVMQFKFSNVMPSKRISINPKKKQKCHLLWGFVNYALTKAGITPSCVCVCLEPAVSREVL